MSRWNEMVFSEGAWKPRWYVTAEWVALFLAVALFFIAHLWLFPMWFGSAPEPQP